jgi:hypothetical protein
MISAVVSLPWHSPELQTTLMECSTRAAAQQQLHYQHILLVTAVFGHARLRSLAGRHVEEAALQPSHHPFLQLAIMASNSNFKKKLCLKPRRITYSL